MLVVSGRVAYVGPGGLERGREWFRFLRGASGERTMQAFSEIDDSRIERAVTYRVDAGWRPVDAHVSLAIAGQEAGSAWYRFGPRAAECEGWLAAGGRIHRRVELDRPALAFGPHPVVADCWFAAHHDPAGPARQPVRPSLTSSPAPNGGTGPDLHRFDVELELRGVEEVEVAAGRFRARHYTVHAAGLPPEEIWVGPGNLLVRIWWDVYRTSYELAELRLEGAEEIEAWA